MQLVDNSKSGAVAVTPSDTVNLVFPSGTNHTRGLYIGGAGNIKVKMADGTEVTFTAVAVGTLYELSVVRVFATGTTATLIVAVF